MHIRVTFESGRIIETLPRSFMDIMDEARVSFDEQGEDLTEVEVLEQVMDQISGMSSEFDKGVDQMPNFKLMLPNNVMSYISTSKIETIDIIAGKEFAKDAVKFAEFLEEQEEERQRSAPEMIETEVQAINRRVRFNEANRPFEDTGNDD